MLSGVLAGSRQGGLRMPPIGFKVYVGSGNKAWIPWTIVCRYCKPKRKTTTGTNYRLPIFWQNHENERAKMTETNNSSVDDLSKREIVIMRVSNAPRELVFEAWTDPKHLVEWWGPKGFTTTV